MSEVKSWSGTAASNNSSPPDGFPESMQYSQVNNAARELMAAVVRWHDDFDGELVSGGSSNAYTLTPNVTYSAYEAGMSFIFLANHANTGAATLNVSALGAKDLRDSQGSALTSGAIGVRQPIIAVYDASNGYFRTFGTNFVRLTGGTMSGGLVISATDNSNALLRVTQLGTANAIEIEDSSNPDSTPFAVDATGMVLIGTSTNTASISNPKLVIRHTTASTGISIRSDPASGNPSILALEKSVSSGTVASGDVLGRIQGYGHDGTGMIEAARIDMTVDGTPGTNDMPGRIVFNVTADGASSVSEAARISNDKSFLFKGSAKSDSATAGIGYATGAGGTVTQATSRTTCVTINKVCGAITLVSAAGSGGWETFTVTNSTVAATDTVVLSQKSGTDKYMLHVTAVGAGSFDITYATTGGTTTEQPVFNFSVIKAVAA